MSDFYYELAVQIIEICNSMQARTGGLIFLGIRVYIAYKTV